VRISAGKVVQMGKQLPSRRDPDDEDDEGSKVDRTSSSD
jgi:hypothetical protein